jgi:hypothetical protein
MDLAHGQMTHERHEDNPYVGSHQHKHERQADLTGRAMDRALERGYGMPGKNKARKKKKRRRR